MTTGSSDAIKTAATVFPHATYVANCVAVSDAPLHFDFERWRTIALGYTLDGAKVLDPRTPEEQGWVEDLIRRIATEVQGTREQILEKVRGARLITDDNMAPEWE